MTNHTTNPTDGRSGANHPARGLVAVILAAGKGTRMQSDLPKVMHPVMGRPMVHWVVDAARAAGATKVVLVIGHGADLVRDYFAGVPALAGQVEPLMQLWQALWALLRREAWGMADAPPRIWSV